MAYNESDVWQRKQKLSEGYQGPIEQSQVKKSLGQAGGYVSGMQTGYSPDERARVINSIATRGALQRQRADEDIKRSAAAGGFSGSSAVPAMVGEARTRGSADLSRQLTDAEMAMLDAGRREAFQKGGMLTDFATRLASLGQGQERMGQQEEQYYQSLMSERDARDLQQENWIKEFARMNDLDEEDAKRWWSEFNLQKEYDEEERDLFMDDRLQAEKERRRLLAELGWFNQDPGPGLMVA